jgi:hypothetical protein
MLIKSIINQDNIQQGTLCVNLYYDNILKTFGKKRITEISKNRQIQKKSFLANLSAFNDSVIYGTLYDDFIQRYGFTRKEVKKIIFAVFFSKNAMFKRFNSFIPYKKDKEVFASVYPFIYGSIEHLKAKNNVLLLVFLQKLESYIFIDCIAKDLVNAGIVPLTVHDSVIIKVEDKEKTMELIKKVFFDNFNVIPTFDIKPLKL